MDTNCLSVHPSVSFVPLEVPSHLQSHFPHSTSSNLHVPLPPRRNPPHSTPSHTAHVVCAPVPPSTLCLHSLLPPNWDERRAGAPFARLSPPRPSQIAETKRTHDKRRSPSHTRVSPRTMDATARRSMPSSRSPGCWNLDETGRVRWDGMGGQISRHQQQQQPPNWGGLPVCCGVG